jgi:hypothetical protein
MDASKYAMALSKRPDLCISCQSLRRLDQKHGRAVLEIVGMAEYGAENKTPEDLVASSRDQEAS